MSILLLSVCSVPILGGLSGCGFHLRGYDAPMRYAQSDVILLIDDNRDTFLLKQPLIKHLRALGINTTDSISVLAQQSAQSAGVIDNSRLPAVIKIDNLNFQKYELIGVLTEIRQVIHADVTFQFYKNGQWIELKNPLQIERSYQYNAASVSTEDQQGQLIRNWLYDSLAQRITDQYVALNLPHVSPKISSVKNIR